MKSWKTEHANICQKNGKKSLSQEYFSGKLGLDVLQHEHNVDDVQHGLMVICCVTQLQAQGLPVTTTKLMWANLF